MKKAVIVIIFAIYIASIAIVNFFGLEIAIFEGTTYVSDIEILSVIVENGEEESYELESTGTTVDEHKIETINYVFYFTEYENDGFDEEDEEVIPVNPNMIILEYAVRPNTADNKEVDFIYDKDAYDGLLIFHEGKATIEFLKPNVNIEITISSTDGHNVKKRVNILCLKA